LYFNGGVTQNKMHQLTGNLPSYCDKKWLRLFVIMELKFQNHLISHFAKKEKCSKNLNHQNWKTYLNQKNYKEENIAFNLSYVMVVYINVFTEQKMR
jgi:hypothetical protein